MKCSLGISNFLEELSVATAAAKLLQSCLTLCNSMDHSQPGSSVHGILQARMLKSVAMPSSRALFDPELEPQVLYILLFGRWVLYH